MTPYKAFNFKFYQKNQSIAIKNVYFLHFHIKNFSSGSNDCTTILSLITEESAPNLFVDINCSKSKRFVKISS